MSFPTPPADIALPARTYSPVDGLLSYLVPGLGQIRQGRVGKGLLFLIALHGMFFFGMYLGSWQNVYVDYAEGARQRGGGMVETLLQKARFAGQFWIGIAAWPAIVQYFSLDPNQPRPEPDKDRHPLLGRFQRKPSEAEVNQLFQNEDKKPDLGWMYTVIAGVLNVLVIYDAFAGPAFAAAAHKPAEITPRPTEEPAVT
jgi:hypothetical protein